MTTRLALRVPADIAGVVRRLQEAGHEAYVVGGCVRDALRGVVPADWDVATSALPPDVQELFRRSLYTNRFGTVVVRAGEREVEVTTYRLESDYADHRRPETVAFTDSLEADLSRRDFTMNAMAWRPADGGGELVDPFGGRADLERRLVRAVGDAGERFAEDALRMLRAVRFATLLRMDIEPVTAAAIGTHAHLAAEPFGERIQQELLKILLAPVPSVGLRMLSDLGLPRSSAPSWRTARAIPQDKAVAVNVFEHSLITVDATPADDLVLRLAGLFHDVGKPETFADGHFHQHEFVGEAKARAILRRWKLPKDTIAAVTHLIRNHMFWYQTDWTGSAVRRFVRKIGLKTSRRTSLSAPPTPSAPSRGPSGCTRSMISGSAGGDPSPGRVLHPRPRHRRPRGDERAGVPQDPRWEGAERALRASSTILSSTPRAARAGRGTRQEASRSALRPGERGR